MNTIEHVAVIGLGYIGLPTAAILASKGLRVSGVDTNEKTVTAVNAGQVPFVEPGLGAFVQDAVKDGHLTAVSQTPSAAAYIVAVPTPFLADRSVDERFIRAAAEGIAPQLSGGELVILESTSPPRHIRPHGRVPGGTAPRPGTAPGRRETGHSCGPLP